MKTLSKSQLKAKMLEYFRKIEQTGEELIVTDNGKPVIKVSPFKKNKDIGEIFADAKGKMKYSEDLTTSTISEWKDS